MKSLLRKTAIYAFALFLLPQVLSGVKIAGGLPTLFLGGLILTLLSILLRPLLTILTLPLNIITLGLFSSFINVVLLYLLTVLVPQITIQAFIFHGFTFVGFVIPKISFNVFFAFVASSIMLSYTFTIIQWFSKR